MTGIRMLRGGRRGVQLAHGVLGEVAAGPALASVVLLDEDHSWEVWGLLRPLVGEVSQTAA